VRLFCFLCKKSTKKGFPLKSVTEHFTWAGTIGCGSGLAGAPNFPAVREFLQKPFYSPFREKNAMPGELRGAVFCNLAEPFEKRRPSLQSGRLFHF
jgi:hypothetical protein